MNKSLPDFLENPNPDLYRSNNYVVLDFETTTKNNGSALDSENKILLAVWRLGSEHPDYRQARGSNLHSKWAGEFELSELVEACNKADYIVAHNAKFELQWLARAGLDLSTVIPFDTQIAEYVILGNIRKPLNLNSCAARYSLGSKMDAVSLMIKGGVSTEDIPRKWLHRYCVKDVNLCESLFLRQREILYNQGLAGVVYTRNIFTPVLADMETYGLAVDYEKVKALHAEISKKLTSVNKELNELTGGMNPNSPKQKAEFMYDVLGFEEIHRHGKPVRTPAGGRKTSADVIKKLKPKNKKQRRFLELMKLQADYDQQVSMYLNKLLACCEEGGGVLYAQFNQTVARNHRLSSTGLEYKIQFQNIDRRMKRLFCARSKDYCIGEIDQAQLEFRAAVYLGQDATGMEDINTGVDKHNFTACVLNEVNPDEVTKDMRQDAKSETFKPLFGGTSGTKKQMAYYKAFRERHKHLYETQKGWTNDVLKHKQLTMPTGLVFYWPDTKMTRIGFITNTQAIFNYPVSYLSGAEIVPVGIIHLWHSMKANKMKSFLINTVHDSGIGEIFSKERELFASLAVKSFTDDVYTYLYKLYGIKFNVPLGVGVTLGPCWSEGEEVKYESTPPTYKEAA